MLVLLFVQELRVNRRVVVPALSMHAGIMFPAMPKWTCCSMSMLLEAVLRQFSTVPVTLMSMCMPLHCCALLMAASMLMPVCELMPCSMLSVQRLRRAVACCQLLVWHMRVCCLQGGAWLRWACCKMPVPGHRVNVLLPLVVILCSDIISVEMIIVILLQPIWLLLLLLGHTLCLSLQRVAASCSILRPERPMPAEQRCCQRVGSSL